MFFLQKILYRKANLIVVSLALGFSSIFIYLFGIAGFMKSANFGDDFFVFFRAGRLLLSGENPWTSLMVTTQPFSYPPQSTALLTFYGLMTPTFALVTHTIINLFSVVVIAICSNNWLTKVGKISELNFLSLLTILLIVTNPYVTTSIFQGQLTLPVTAALFVSWVFKDKSILISGILLGFSTIKPQFSLLYIIWLALNASIDFRRHAAILIVGGVSALVMALPTFVILGPIDSFGSWITSFSGYENIGINSLGSPYVVGIESYLASIGIDGVGIYGKVLAVLLTVMIFKYRRYVEESVVACCLLVITFTFIYAHDYDYCSIIFLWGALFYYAIKAAKPKYLVFFFVAGLWFFMPQRYIRDSDIQLIVHARTFIVIVLALAVIKIGANIKTLQNN